VLTRIGQSDEWKRDMERNAGDSDLMNSAQTTKFLRTQYERYRAALNAPGLAKQ
jgi:tripartite-type tricarboxylate transporter receptor subunit TctC